jgi:hypothetical protein
LAAHRRRRVIPRIDRITLADRVVSQFRTHEICSPMPMWYYQE